MKPILPLCAVVLALSAPLAHAQAPQPLFDGSRWWFPSLRQQWQQRQCWCPDDYCRKQLPNVSCVPRGCVDDYCPKSLPTVPCPPKGCVDDYCPKHCPLILGKTCEPWYTCGPAPHPEVGAAHNDVPR
jgi:hypothetical protein